MRRGDARAASRARPDHTTLLGFALLIVLAGGNAIAIRESYQDGQLEQLWSASLRFAGATIMFVVLALVLRAEFPRGRALVGAMLYGVLFFGGGFGLIHWGLLEAPAGLSQVLLAIIPLLTFVFALAHRLESFRMDGFLGAVISAAGIVVIFVGSIDDGVPMSSMLAILAGAVCWAEGLVVVKRYPPVHPVMMNLVAMATGSVMLITASFALGERHPFSLSAHTWWALGYASVIGTLVVFLLVLFVLRRWTASASSFQFVLFPLVTVALGVWLQDEQITWLFLIGAVLVVAGVYLGVLRQAASRIDPAPASTDGF